VKGASPVPAATKIFKRGSSRSTVSSSVNLPTARVVMLSRSPGFIFHSR
jgi:hypothetical protein